MALPAVVGTVRRMLLAVLSPVIRRAGRAYLAAPTRRDAIEIARLLSSSGYGVTLAYWNASGDPPGAIEAEVRGAADALAGWPHQPQVAVKAPTLQFSDEAVRRIARVARAAGVGLVFDSHAPEDTDATLELARTARHEGAEVGVAVPARWARSLRDALSAVASGLSIRVVKGQWADAGSRGTSGEGRLRRSYLRLIDQLATAKVPVSIATHDPTVLKTLLSRPSWSGGGPRGVELLLGLPAAPLLRLAAADEAPVRFYVGYGSPGLAFKLTSIMRRPRLAVIFARGVVLGRRNQALRLQEALADRAECRPVRPGGSRGDVTGKGARGSR